LRNAKRQNPPNFRLIRAMKRTPAFAGVLCISALVRVCLLWSGRERDSAAKIGDRDETAAVIQTGAGGDAALTAAILIAIAIESARRVEASAAHAARATALVAASIIAIVVTARLCHKLTSFLSDIFVVGSRPSDRRSIVDQPPRALFGDGRARRRVRTKCSAWLARRPPPLAGRFPASLIWVCGTRSPRYAPRAVNRKMYNASVIRYSPRLCIGNRYLK
jgi:hypothetical protein